VIARLDTYRKVQKHLRRVECEEPPEAVPAPLFHNHEEVGAITTAVPGVRQALGFIRSTLAKKTRMYFISAKGHVDVRVSESN
jgi:folate-binding Fe-S cluster repair protein YgfZ